MNYNVFKAFINFINANFKDSTILKDPIDKVVGCVKTSNGSTTMFVSGLKDYRDDPIPCCIDLYKDGTAKMTLNTQVFDFVDPAIKQFQPRLF